MRLLPLVALFLLPVAARAEEPLPPPAAAPTSEVLAPPPSLPPGIHVGESVIVTRSDGTTVIGTVKSVSPAELVLTTENGREVRIDAGDLQSLHEWSAPRERGRNLQHDDGFDHVVFWNPIYLIGSVLAVGYEKRLTPNTTMLSAVRLQYRSYREFDGTHTTVSAAGIILQPHYYFRPKAPRGPYVAPFGEYVHFRLTNSASPSATYDTLEAGATLGWSWMISRVNIKFGLGGGYYFFNYVGANSASVNRQGGAIAGDLDFGFAF